MNLLAKGFINLRDAQTENASQIAPLMIEAGGGIYQFLFEGFGPEGGLVDIIEKIVSADRGPYCFQNCLIAEKDGQFAGFANTFPARLIRDQGSGPIPQERLDHLAPLNEIMDWESFFLNSIGVLPSHRGQGVGDALIQGVLAKAGEQSFQNVTLQVLEKNDTARKLYERHGFAVARTTVLEPHPMLPDTRSFLMRRELARG